MPPARPSVADIRRRFPGLSGADVLLDNAGGSQVPTDVVEQMSAYLRETYVQLGADYGTSRRAVEVIDRAHAFARTLVNGEGLGQAILGPSTSALCAMLADCYARCPADGRDEVVVAEGGHESNVAPWERLAARGYRVRWWRPDPETGHGSLDDLAALVGPRTRLVCVHHVSNLLGAVEDVPAITRIAHAAGARVLVDGVAYAPHRAIDVADLGVDWYAFSTYKVYGPHMAVLFGRSEALAELEGPGFDFVRRDDVPYKFELGGVNHEGCAALLGTERYLAFLAGRPEEAPIERATVEAAFARMCELELPLQARVLDFLNGRPELRVVGPRVADRSRVATLSFVHPSRRSRDLAVAANERGFGIRYGHFYSIRLVRALGLDPADGVVRVSLVHYNEEGEVGRLLEFLGGVV